MRQEGLLEDVLIGALPACQLNVKNILPACQGMLKMVAARACRLEKFFVILCLVVKTISFYLYRHEVLRDSA